MTGAVGGPSPSSFEPEKYLGAKADPEAWRERVDAVIAAFNEAYEQGKKTGERPDYTAVKKMLDDMVERARVQSYPPFTDHATAAYQELYGLSDSFRLLPPQDWDPSTFQDKINDIYNNDLQYINY